MKKKLMPALLVAMLLAFGAGCASNNSELQTEKIQEETDAGSETETAQEQADNLKDATKENGEDSLEITEQPEITEEEAFDTDALFTGWLPQGVEQIKAETQPNELLRQAIIDYYEIPEEFWEQTRYYYNYVDLNGDGAEEIFAVIIGSYTSGSGGDSALWCREYEGEMKIMQAFTLVNTPVIVTEEALNGREYGAKGLIMQRRGGGAETEIVQLSCSDGVYTNVADAPVIENPDEIQGTAIICNNLIEDMESGNFLTLAE